MTSIKGTDEIVQRFQALGRQNIPKMIHGELLRQLRRKRAQIPRATGALERSLLDGSDDTVSAHRVTIEGLAYGQYQDIPKLDARREPRPQRARVRDKRAKPRSQTANTERGVDRGEGRGETLDSD